MRGARLLLLFALAGCDRDVLPGDPFSTAQCESPPDAGPSTTWCRDPSWQWIGLAPEESSARAMAVWGRADDAWFVFQHPTNLPLEGAIYHWDGAVWRREWWSTRWGNPPNPDDLYAIWGSGDDDLWVVGDSGTILHSNGSGCWFHVASPTKARLLQIAGRGPSDVVAVGEGGASIHWDGSEWSSVPTGVTSDFSAISHGGSFLWATTIDGDILRWDGASWSSTGSTSATLSGIWAASDDDAWAVGDKVILRWNGSGWASIPVETSACETGGTGVWGASANDVWIAGCDYGGGGHWDGQSFSTDFSLYGQMTDGWTLRWNNAAHFDAGTWNDVITNEDLTAIAVAGEDQAWAVSDAGGVWHFDGTGWKLAHRADHRLFAVAVAGGQLWAAGEGAVLHFDGSTWNALPDIPNGIGPVTSLWASAPDDVYARDTTALRHWDGTTWSTSFADNDDAAVVWGSARNDVWLLGNKPDAQHFDGTGWLSVPFLSTTHGRVAPPSGTANDLWVQASVYVFMQKMEAPILHWDGASWSVAATIPKYNDSVGFRARVANDAWVADFDGMHHWDGQSLSCAINWHEPMRAMAGTPDDLWFSGGDGTVFRRRSR